LKPDDTGCFFCPISRVTFHFNFDDWRIHFQALFIFRQLKITTK
jgi:hypothetical protein